MKKAVYKERRTYIRYDENHIIGYLNEEVIEDYQPEAVGEEEPVPPFVAYQYTGTESDGGTVMECKKQDDRGELVNAVIRAKYSLSEELAIQRHFATHPEEYQEEFEEYSAWCERAKEIVSGWIEE